MHRGFTLIELLVVVAILLIVASIVVSSFSRFNKITILNNSVAEVVSLLNEARSNTVASRNDERYGVHFESGRVVVFIGDVYVVGAASNEVIQLSPEINITSITLVGGGNDVVFDRLFGTTAQPGTITIASATLPQAVKQIVVSGNGVITVI